MLPWGEEPAPVDEGAGRRDQRRRSPPPVRTSRPPTRGPHVAAAGVQPEGLHLQDGAPCAYSRTTVAAAAAGRRRAGRAAAAGRQLPLQRRLPVRGVRRQLRQPGDRQAEAGQERLPHARRDRGAVRGRRADRRGRLDGRPRRERRRGPAPVRLPLGRRQADLLQRLRLRAVQQDRRSRATRWPTASSKQFGIQYFNDAWWIAYDSEWIGYFPGNLWDDKYTESGLIQWFGEVAASSLKPCTEMGTGTDAATTGRGRPDRQHRLHQRPATCRRSRAAGLAAPSADDPVYSGQQAQRPDIPVRRPRRLLSPTR